MTASFGVTLPGLSQAHCPLDFLRLLIQLLTHVYTTQCSIAALQTLLMFILSWMIERAQLDSAAFFFELREHAGALTVAYPTFLLNYLLHHNYVRVCAVESSISKCCKAQTWLFSAFMTLCARLTTMLSRLGKIEGKGCYRGGYARLRNHNNNSTTTEW